MEAVEGAVVVGGLAVIAYVVAKSWKKAEDGPKPPPPGTVLTPQYWLPTIPGIDPRIVAAGQALYDKTLKHLEYGAPTPQVGKDGKLCPCGTDAGGNCNPCGSDLGYKVYGVIESGAGKVASAGSRVLSAINPF